MLKDVRMTVPKRRETSACNIYAARQGMKYICSKAASGCNNNNMRSPSLHLFYYGVTHVIIVACPHTLSCCIYTALVSLLFGAVIPTSFNILIYSLAIIGYHYTLCPCALFLMPYPYLCLHTATLHLNFLALSSLHPLTF